MYIYIYLSIDVHIYICMYILTYICMYLYVNYANLICDSARDMVRSRCLRTARPAGDSAHVPDCCITSRSDALNIKKA